MTYRPGEVIPPAGYLEGDVVLPSSVRCDIEPRTDTSRDHEKAQQPKKDFRILVVGVLRKQQIDPQCGYPKRNQRANDPPTNVSFVAHYEHWHHKECDGGNRHGCVGDRSKTKQ